VACRRVLSALPFRGVLPTVSKIKKLKSGRGPTICCRAIDDDDGDNDDDDDDDDPTEIRTKYFTNNSLEMSYYFGSIPLSVNLSVNL
jgi:hypothetical protein